MSPAEDTKTSTHSENISAWQGDLLDRKKYADFLTDFLTTTTLNKSKTSDSKSMTVALNAEWGQGKSFFVKNWMSDITTNDGVAIYFDAWSHDYHEDALISFITNIAAEIQDIVKSKGKLLEESKRTALNDSVAKTLTSLGKFLVRFSEGVALHYLKGKIGDEATDALKNFNNKNEIAAIKDGLNDSIDSVFDNLIVEQKEKENGLSEFRESLEEFTRLLSENNVKLPLFIFVDELDRCRPTFAIDLLETIKHVFNVPNICFVVSTHLAQLAESVKGGYGNGFEGARYLERLFDHVIGFPPADKTNHHKFILTEFLTHCRNHRVEAHSNLPQLISSNGSNGYTESTCIDTFTLLSEIFDLDVRTEEKVANLISVATAPLIRINSKSGIQFFWLNLLCILWLIDKPLFNSLKYEESAASIKKLDDRTGAKFSTSSFTMFERNHYGLGVKKVYCFKDVVAVFISILNKNILELRNQERNTDELAKFPNSMLSNLFLEAPQTYNTGSYIEHSINHYFDFIKMAGYIK